MQEQNYVNPLLTPVRYDLETILKELMFGRPAEDQILIKKWIDELTEEPATSKIELPTIDEINEKANMFYRNTFLNTTFYHGAKWMRDKILNKNK